MKYIYSNIILLLLIVPVMAQDQFTNSGNFAMHAGATIAFYGDVKNNGTFSGEAINITFKGNLKQEISGSSSILFHDLTLSNAAGVILQKPISVSNTLSLLTGPLMLNTQTLTVLRNDVTAISRSDGFILSEETDNSSKIRWTIGNKRDKFIFPFGTVSGTYIPLSFELTDGDAGTVVVSTYPTNADNKPYPVTPDSVTHISDVTGTDNSSNVVDRFWQIDKDGPTGTATINCIATGVETGSISDLKVQIWNDANGGWGLPLPGQTNTATGATVPDVSVFGVFCLTGFGTVLPVEMVQFSAIKNSDRVDIFWETRSEKNSDYFTIQKTSDGESFEQVIKIKAAGNSNSTLTYTAKDNNPLKGLSYYRLVLTDMDGVQDISQLVPVRFENTGNIEVRIFPNPTIKENLHISVSHADGQNAVFSIRDISGKLCFSETKYIDNPMYDFRPEFNFPGQGIYFITVVTNDTSVVKKVVLQ